MSQLNILINDVTSAVAAKDASDNDNFMQVVGNKTDTAKITADVSSVINLLRWIVENLNTDSEVAANLGAIANAAHTGAVDNATTGFGYLKQLVTDLLVVKGDFMNGGRLDLIFDAIKTITDALPNSGALTSLAQASVLGAPVGASISVDIAAVKTVVNAIKTITDALPNSGALTSLAQASVLGSPVGASISVDIAAVKTVVNAIKAITDVLPDAGALTSLASAINLAAVKTVVDDIKTVSISGKLSGSFVYTNAGAEQTICTLTTVKRVRIECILLDLNNITENGTIKVYNKIDGTNYRELKGIGQAFAAATDPDGIVLNSNLGITNDLKVTYTESSDEGADRTIYYTVIYSEIE